MGSSRAEQLNERLNHLLISVHENGLQGSYAIYVFHGFPAGGGAFGGSGSTPSTKNVKDHLRAKGLVLNTDYEWVTPLTLKILQQHIDRDLLNSIQSSGGFEHHENPRTEIAEENEKQQGR